jgi:hypothetical protein
MKKICFQIGTGCVIIKNFKIWNLFLNFLQIFKIVRIWIRTGDSEFTDSDPRGQYPDPQHWPEGAVPYSTGCYFTCSGLGWSMRRNCLCMWRQQENMATHMKNRNTCTLTNTQAFAANYIFSVIHALSKLRSPIWATWLRIIFVKCWNAGSQKQES